MSRSPCCPENSQPFLAEDPCYIPVGENIKIDETINAYVVGKGPICLILIHDLFGLNSGMNRLICDNLSRRLPNATVVAPDFFPHGNLLGNDPLTQRGENSLKWKVIWSYCTCQLVKFIQRYSWENSTEHIFNAVTTHMMKAPHHCEKFVPLGVCWGSYAGFMACLYAEHKEHILGEWSACFFLLRCIIAGTTTAALIWMFWWFVILGIDLLIIMTIISLSNPLSIHQATFRFIPQWTRSLVSTNTSKWTWSMLSTALNSLLAPRTKNPSGNRTVSYSRHSP